MAMFNTGPTIEGLVSPTASKKTITKALSSPAATASSGGYGTTPQTSVLLKPATTQPLPPPTLGWENAGAMGALLGGVVGSNPTVIETLAAANPSNVTVSYPGGGGTGGGGTGGGGFESPTGVGGGGAGGGTNGLETAVNNPGLGQVSREAIEAQIGALEAQYGLDLASIAALGGEIGAQARFLLDQIAIDQGRAQEGLIGDLVARGILRSGVTARDLGRQAQDFAVKRGEVELNKGQRLRQLAERAGAAGASLGRGKADVIAEIDRGNLNAELRQQLLGELNSLSPADIQRALDAAYQGAPSSITGLISQNATQSLGIGGFGPTAQPRGQLTPEVLAMLQANPQIDIEDPLLSTDKNALRTANRGY